MKNKRHLKVLKGKKKEEMKFKGNKVNVKKVRSQKNILYKVDNIRRNKNV